MEQTLIGLAAVAIFWIFAFPIIKLFESKKSSQHESYKNNLSQFDRYFLEYFEKVKKSQDATNYFETVKKIHDEVAFAGSIEKFLFMKRITLVRQKTNDESLDALSDDDFFNVMSVHYVRFYNESVKASKYAHEKIQKEYDGII